MISPQGWYRARLYFRTLQRYPAYGSPAESICLALLRREDQLHALELRALLEGAVYGASEGSKGDPDKYYRMYLQQLYPYVEGLKEKEKKEQAKVLRKFVEQGPLAVKPLDTLPGERMATRTKLGAERLQKLEEAMRLGLIKRG